MFVLHEARQTSHIGRGGNPRQLEIAALDRIEDVLKRTGINRQKVKIGGQAVAHLPTGIGKPCAVIEGEVYRMSVQNLPVFAIVGHIASGQHPADIALADRAAIDLDLTIKAIGPRPCAAERNDGVINPKVGHLLRGRNGGADCAFGFLHGIDFAEANPARAGRRRADHPEGALPSHRADPIALAEAVGSVEAQNKAGDLGGADIKDRDDAALKRRLPDRTHGALGFVKLPHLVACS